MPTDGPPEPSPASAAPETEASFVTFSFDDLAPDDPSPTPEPLPVPRPSLGVLVADDGQEVELDGDLVLGREPAPGAGPGVRAVELHDPQLAMSRVHCRVVLDGREVRVEDAHSANGTFVAPPGQQWTRLMAGVPVAITPGTRIALGSRSLTYQSARED